MIKIPTRELRGHQVPQFCYGTAWKEDATTDLVKTAISQGFRFIDTANQRKHYFEAAVGEALAQSWKTGDLQRSDFFLQSKYTFQAGQDHRLPYDPIAPIAKQVQQSFSSSLEHLGTEYLDSYVLHGPSTRQGLLAADWEAWRAMESLQKQGKTRMLGVSNISATQLKALLAQADIKPAFVQNRCFADMAWDAEVRQICQEHDMVYQGFSLLTANIQALQTPLVGHLLQREQCTLPQLVFAFALQKHILPLTGTSSAQHMLEDLQVFERQWGDLSGLEHLGQ